MNTRTLFLFLFMHMLVKPVVYGQQDSIGQSKKTDSPLEQKLYSSKNSDSLYVDVRSFPERVIKVEPLDKDFSISTLISVLALIISTAAFSLPLYFNRLSERKANFLKMYEYWNSDYMLNKRTNFWIVVREFKNKGEQVCLQELLKSGVDRYHNFERIYDFMRDLAILTNKNQIDRDFLKTIMSLHIQSYARTLETSFIFYETEDLYFKKMNKDYYIDLINIRDDLFGRPKEEKQNPDKLDDKSDDFGARDHAPDQGENK